jgi:hypothetical protein
VDALRLLGKHGLKLMIQVINIYVTGERPKDLIEFTTIGLKKPKTKKNAMIVAHIAMIVARILRRRIEKKIWRSSVWIYNRKR